MSGILTNAIGVVGVILILSAYFALQIKKMSPSSVVFSSFNAVGSGLILISLYFDFNLASFLIESAWLLVSLYGVSVAIREMRLKARI